MRSATKSRYKPVRSLAQTVRERLQSGIALVQFYESVYLGKERGFTGRDRLVAAQWLSDRGWGRAVETTVQLEAEKADADATLGLTDASLEALARGLKLVAKPDLAPITVTRHDLTDDPGTKNTPAAPDPISKIA